MPVYEFACADCGHLIEELRPLGADTPSSGGCPACGGALRRRWSRVAVRYSTWGFKATDGLVRDNRGKDFSHLRERAEQISDEN